MLTPEQLAYCADDIVNLYAQLEQDIVRDIARRISQTGIITETGKLQINALQQLGTLHTDILSSISKYTDLSDEQIKKLFEDASVTATEYDNEIYRAHGLNPKSIKVSASQMQILEAGYKKTVGNINNLTKTTAVSSQTKFINSCTLAELKVESGAFSAEQAIMDAIKQFAIDGPLVLYPSGHTDKLDVAVRRNVMTGIGQTTGEICLANARELGQDLMEITAHAGARPSHASWQGQIVSLSGKKGYLSLSDIGYGTGDGFKGWNCRHDWFPYFEDSTRMYSERDLEELDAKNIEFPDGSMHTLYEAEQKQRAYERTIREIKRILAAQDEVIKTTSSEGLKKALQMNFDDFSVKLKRKEAEMKAFCKKTGLLPDTARTQKYGFGRSTAQKAVWNNKKNVAKSAQGGIIKLRKVDARDKISSIDTSTIQDLNSGFSCFPKDDILNTYIKKVEPKDSYYDIGLHGTPTAVCFGTDEPNTSPKLLARIIKHRKDYNGENIRLLSCSTGKKINNEYCFAEELSNALGVKVEAPNDLLYISSKGTITVGDDYLGKMVVYSPNERGRVK